ncbi:hypothetical protein [Tardisphaera saccharovorans]
MPTYHYRIFIELNHASFPPQSNLESVASKYLNVEPGKLFRHTNDEGYLFALELRINHDNPLKTGSGVGDPCELIYPTIQFLREVNLVWNIVKILETVTYEVEGAAGGAGLGGLLGASTDDLGKAVISAILGGAVGYLMGDIAEKIVKELCVYENQEGNPVLVSRSRDDWYEHRGLSSRG